MKEVVNVRCKEAKFHTEKYKDYYDRKLCGWKNKKSVVVVSSLKSLQVFATKIILN